MFVFKFLRPVSALPGVESAGPGLSPLPSFPCLTRLVCRVGHLAKPLPLTVQQLGLESLELESWGDGRLCDMGEGPPGTLQAHWRQHGNVTCLFCGNSASLQGVHWLLGRIHCLEACVFSAGEALFGGGWGGDHHATSKHDPVKSLQNIFPAGNL